LDNGAHINHHTERSAADPGHKNTLHSVLFSVINGRKLKEAVGWEILITPGQQYN
jgi:hypothetical protein